MTRAQLRTELQATGFGTSTAEVTSQNAWLDMGYAFVWAAADWLFKKVDQASLTVTAADSTPTMPTDLGSVDWINDNYGCEMIRLDPEEFDAYFAVVPTQSGPPWGYKVVNRIVTLGPTPSAAATFTWSYRRRVTHYDVANAIVAGPMSVDTDYPFWPAEHHHVLVYHAAMVGHALRSNPAAVTMQGLRDDALEAMKEDLGPELAPGLQWGTVWGC